MSNFLIHNPGCIFIHIPKTAGTSIRMGFFKEEFEGPAFGEIPAHWPSYFSFAFVRNPYDRVIRAWKMFARGTSEAEPVPPNVVFVLDKSTSMDDV